MTTDLSQLMQLGRCVLVQAIKRETFQMATLDPRAIAGAIEDDEASPAELRLYDLSKAGLQAQPLVDNFMAVILGLTVEGPVAFFGETAKETHERAILVITAIIGPLDHRIDLDDPELGPMRPCPACRERTPVDEGMACGSCGSHVCQPCFAKYSSCNAPECAPMIRG